LVPSLASAALTRRPLRTFLTALGIAIAVGSTVVFLSLGEGLRRAFAQELSAVGPDLQISFGDFTTTSFGAVPELPIEYVRQLEERAEAFGIRSVMPLLIHVRSGLSAASSVVFQGVPPAHDVGEVYFDLEIVEGRALDAGDEGAAVAVVGEQAAARSSVGVGGVFRLNPRASFEVVGIVRAGGGLLDNTIIVPLTTLQAAIGVEDRVSFLVVELETPTAAPAVAEQIRESFPELGVQTRDEFLTLVERGLAVSDVVRLGISAIALIVGAIAVANTMLMSVFERTREFGVVRAVGARPRFLFGLVLLESVALALVGAVAGVALGYLGAGIVNHISMDLIAVAVAAITPRLILFAVVVAAAMGILAGLIPAARAARVPIAVALARD
jgi:putative ABC transport system permease protein